MSESEWNQLLERRSIGGNPRLVAALAMAVIGAPADVPRRDVIRDFTRRLRPYLAFVDVRALPAISPTNSVDPCASKVSTAFVPVPYDAVNGPSTDREHAATGTVTSMAEAQLPIPSSVSVSGRMSRQRRRDTQPEVAIRKLLHAMGLRYRVTVPIPGMPRRTMDIAFTRAHVAVFVDGCFWHVCPEHATSPASNSDWWTRKLTTNKSRDRATNEHLAALGWQVVRIWEHEDPVEAADRIAAVVRSEKR